MAILDEDWVSTLLTKVTPQPLRHGRGKAHFLSVDDFLWYDTRDRVFLEDFWHCILFNFATSGISIVAEFDEGMVQKWHTRASRLDAIVILSLALKAVQAIMSRNSL